MSETAWTHQIDRLREATTLDPSTEWSVTRANYLVLRDKAAAQREAGSVVRKEPDNLAAWSSIAVAARGRDRVALRRAYAAIRRLNPSPSRPPLEPGGRRPPDTRVSAVVGVIHHVGLAMAVLALGDAGRRMVSPAAPDGLTRVVALAVVGVALAVGEALVLGLVSLGGSSAALVGAALVTWVAAWRALPQPDLSLQSELAAWWVQRRIAERIVVAMLVGTALAWLVWQLRHPSIGFDSSLYHYPFVAGWIDNGRPGDPV